MCIDVAAQPRPGCIFRPYTSDPRPLYLIYLRGDEAIGFGGLVSKLDGIPMVMVTNEVIIICISMHPF